MLLLDGIVFTLPDLTNTPECMMSHPKFLSRYCLNRFTFASKLLHLLL